MSCTYNIYALSITARHRLAGKARAAVITAAPAVVDVRLEIGAGAAAVSECARADADAILAGLASTADHAARTAVLWIADQIRAAGKASAPADALASRTNALARNRILE